MTQRVAILVDGDNISAAYAGRILKIGKNLGRVDLVRTYGNVMRSPWNDVAGYKLVHSGTGKNATDILLAIDAMQLALSGTYTSFVISSSDGDFSHLALRLRELGLWVVGVGEDKAPFSFSKACHRFETLVSERVNKCEITVPKAQVSKMDQNIRSLIQKNSQKGNGIRITDLNHQMRKDFGTKISTHPEKTWWAYLSTRKDLYDLDSCRREAKVRYKPAGFAAPG